jgi:DNA-binding transcriptional LysR family regulator
MPDRTARRSACPLTPDALLMMDTIARTGSFAAAARELGKVPSALTYSVRQLEESLDVLLFDRSSRQAQLTAAGRSCCTKAAACCRRWTPWPTACAAWPAAGKRS